MRRAASTTLSIFAIGLLVVGCGELKENKISPEFSGEKLNVRLDIRLEPSLTALEIGTLRSDFAKIEGMGLAALQGSDFAKIFKGTGSASVLRYIDERVNLFVSEGMAIEKKLRYLNSDAYFPSGFGSEGSTPPSDDKPLTVATNIGAHIWILSQKENRRIGYLSENGSVPVNSTRVGIVQLGKAYTQLHNGTNIIDQIYRSTVLVHEARHSDCTGGFTSDPEVVLADDNTPAKEKACAHRHVTCPSWHSYAGTAACDLHPWGAYAVGGVFASEVAKGCSTCSEFERQLAAQAAADSWSRVLIAEGLNSGVYGEPDMTSDGN